LCTVNWTAPLSQGRDSSSRRPRFLDYRPHSRTARFLAQMSVSRQTQKEHTRQALLDAALGLLEQQSFQGLSLREVTREAGVVPGALYRHFANLEALGVALVEESFQTLRDMLQTARKATPAGQSGREGAAMVLAYAQAHRAQFTFLARERFGGVPAIREAIATATDGFAADVTADFGRSPVLQDWSEDDLRLLADLVVTIMSRAVEDRLVAAPDDLVAETLILDRVAGQLALVNAGRAGWLRREGA
jgi:AcrR family transcriptional regulator